MARTKSVLGCLLARNLVGADAGTRYIHIRHSGWDHHKKIFDHKASTNHYKHCNEIDSAVANLLRDLSAAITRYTRQDTARRNAHRRGLRIRTSPRRAERR